MSALQYNTIINLSESHAPACWAHHRCTASNRNWKEHRDRTAPQQGHYSTVHLTSLPHVRCSFWNNDTVDKLQLNDSLSVCLSLMYMKQPSLILRQGIFCCLTVQKIQFITNKVSKDLWKYTAKVTNQNKSKALTIITMTIYHNH